MAAAPGSDARWPRPDPNKYPPWPLRNRVIVVAVVVAIMAAIIGLFTVPVQTSFSTSFGDYCYYPATAETCPVLNFPSGAHVSGSFSTVGGEPAGLQIVGGSNLVYQSDAAGGSFSFTVSSTLLSGPHSYEFAPEIGGDGSTFVSGTYSAPIL